MTTGVSNNRRFKISMPLFHLMGVAKARQTFYQLAGTLKKVDIPIGSVRDCTVKTARRDTLIRMYSPAGEGSYPAFIFLHGGGFVVGSVEHYDGLCKKIAHDVNCIVISVGYGLAPEHKFPEPVEECYEVAKWVQDQAGRLHIQSGKLAIGGESSGGNLAAAVCLLARERGDLSMVYQVLMYPALDLASDPAGKVKDKADCVIDPETLKWFNDCYLKDSREGANPLASPVLAPDLAGLPAVCMITAGNDPLRAEDELYVQRLRDAGVTVVHQHYDAVMHGFINMTGLLAEAKQAQDLVCRRLRQAFDRQE